MTVLDLVWLLLPVAAASGWFTARWTSRAGRAGAGRRRISADYFKDINYLLNEQPDKAIEIFIRLLEVDSETVETHLALGNLYRRRGEVDRAIRIHQNLVARSTISDEQRYEGLLELAQDYLSAGWLDRAENLFRELVEANRFKVQALRQLIDIYEQEKDWDQAAAAALELAGVTGSQLGNVVAQYRCEQAEHARDGGNLDAALQLCAQAWEVDEGCARASIIEGDIHRARGQWREAVAAYERVEKQDPDYVSEVIESVSSCYAQLGEPERSRDYLGRILEHPGGINAALALTDLIREELGSERAVQFMTEQITRRPTIRGLDGLLSLGVPCTGNPGAVAEQWAVLRSLTRSLVEDRPVYRCIHCGFPAKLLHWRCPGCKHWGSVRPIQGVESE